MSGHTKGPWEHVGHSWSDESIYAGGYQVCTKSIFEDATEGTQARLEAEMGANMRLIAAAPVMLKALEMLIEHWSEDIELSIADEEVRTVAQAALAKAQGGSNG